MESNTQSEATLRRLGNLTVADLIVELNHYPAGMPVKFFNDEGLWTISCISTTKDEENIRVVELS